MNFCLPGGSFRGVDVVVSGMVVDRVGVHRIGIQFTIKINHPHVGSYRIVS